MRYYLKGISSRRQPDSSNTNADAPNKNVSFHFSSMPKSAALNMNFSPSHSSSKSSKRTRSSGHCL